ncbi:MAG: radical SAM family heme chaperone HemW [Peptococcaceae bacterium]|nr:radical SAM family heme chaperone HemW [Peptococcaceae bacterium]
MTISKPVEAVYIHIPFCLRKCNYCDFLSFYRPQEMPGYVEALVKEMEIAVKQYPVQAKTIFIGGGTPSCLPTELLKRVLEAVQKFFVNDALVEYTMEANPGTLNAEKLQIMKQYGVNRLSFGVQSDREDHLKMLGRIHTFEEAKQAVAMARNAGFENINLDFMYGLPGQTVEQWQETLKNAMALKPQHLSLYQLKIEEGTVMYQWLEDEKISEFDDETALAMYRTAQTMLAENGYGQYEISNYAMPGWESLHNQVYWKTDNYLGIGLGACSWVRPERWNNCFEMVDYIGQIAKGALPAQEPEVLNETEQMEETVFMALRMNSGLSKALFAERFGKTVEAVFCDALENCAAQGWIQQTEAGYALTEEGRVLGNLVFLEFMK